MTKRNNVDQHSHAKNLTNKCRLLVFVLHMFFVLDISKRSCAWIVCKRKTKRDSVAFLLNSYSFGMCLDLRFSLCWWWSSTGLLQFQMTAHAVVVLARVDVRFSILFVVTFPLAQDASA